MWVPVDRGPPGRDADEELGDAREVSVSAPQPRRESTALAVESEADEALLGNAITPSRSGGLRAVLRGAAPPSRSLRERLPAVGTGLVVTVLVVLAVTNSAGSLGAVTGHLARGRGPEGKYSEGDYYEGPACLDSAALNDFSSKQGMEQAGWSFNWNDDFTFKPSQYEDFAPQNSYWGLSMSRRVGSVSIVLRGEGVVTLDFGNLLGSPGSGASAFLKGPKVASELQELGHAGPSVMSKQVSTVFMDGDMLSIAEAPMGILVISRVSVECGDGAARDFAGRLRAEQELEERFGTTTTSATTTFTTALMTEPKAPSLYCFSLVLPYGYEPSLSSAQQDQGAGIFACDQHEVFSNSTVLLDAGGGPLPVNVSLISMSLQTPYGGRWYTAQNTPIFAAVWHAVVAKGDYLRHDWTVKADPDSVFFPSRLGSLLRSRGLGELSPPTPQGPEGRRLQDPEASACGKCGLPDREADNCEKAVQWLQSDGHSCEEALELAARPPPEDCGCQCSMVAACNLTAWKTWSLDGAVMRGVEELHDLSRLGPSVYLNNCRFGLHGPLEVFSRAAVTRLTDGLSQCDDLRQQEWGEDKFLDRCLMLLGVVRVNDFNLLSEKACGGDEPDCASGAVAFHPFKDPLSYFQCWTKAAGREPERPDDLVFK